MNRSKYERKTLSVPRLEKVEEPDWGELIQDLIRKGFSKTGIARECEITRERLYGMLESGGKPNWKQGQFLLAMKKIGERV